MKFLYKNNFLNLKLITTMLRLHVCTYTVHTLHTYVKLHSSRNDILSKYSRHLKEHSYNSTLSVIRFQFSFSVLKTKPVF